MQYVWSLITMVSSVFSFSAVHQWIRLTSLFINHFDNILIPKAPKYFILNVLNSRPTEECSVLLNKIYYFTCGHKYEGWSTPKLVSEIRQCLHAIWHYSRDIRTMLTCHSDWLTCHSPMLTCHSSRKHAINMEPCEHTLLMISGYSLNT
jgi:hypothetical protein